MGTDFDVIVVGARCAGSSLATLLARRGARVAVLERVAFPRDTLSTHIFESAAINFLHRLGVGEALEATGAPYTQQIDLRWEDVRVVVRPPLRPGDRGFSMSVRRTLIDPLLADAAGRAGAEVMMRADVVGLHHVDGRVAGVRVRGADGERTLTARLVVGADGRSSTVARLARARRYGVVPGQRFGYWGFYEGADLVGEPTTVFHRWDGRCVIATPADSGLFQVLALPDSQFAAEFAADREAALLAHVRRCEPVAAALGDGARRVGKVLGIKRFEGFFREAAGPGWVLVGDAGHFKDPTPGQGMSDAFRQSEALAPVVLDGLQRDDAAVDRRLTAWWRWRDRDAAPAYGMANDFGAAGRSPELVTEMMRRMLAAGRIDETIDLMQHRRIPTTVFTPRRLVGATAALLRHPGASAPGDRRAILREVGALVREDVRRRGAMARPAFAESADPFEVDEAAADGVHARARARAA